MTFRAHRTTLLLLAIVLVGLYFRTHHIAHSQFFHPDERHIIDVTTRMHPGDMSPHSFAYGGLPFNLLWLAGRAVKPFDPSLVTYDGLFVVGRSLAALFGIGTILMTFIIARMVTGNVGAGLLAAFFFAAAPLPVQLSRFFVVDIILTFFCTASLCAYLRILRNNTLSAHILAGAMTGLALATKVSALSLLVPYAVVGVILLIRSRGQRLLPIIGHGAAFLTSGLVVAVAAAPFSLIEFSTFIKHTAEQVHMASGLWRPPYTVQYAHTTPYLYHLEQMFWYTMGVPLAIAAFAGVLMLTVRQWRAATTPVIVILSYLFAVFFTVAGMQVKFPRYLLPIYPLMFVAAGYALQRARVLIPWQRVKQIPILLVVIPTMIGQLAFSAIYRSPHPYYLSSAWIYDNIPSGSTILNVHWDDTLPLSLPGREPSRYKLFTDDLTLELYEQDTPAKLRSIAEKLSRADYLAFATQRIPGSIPRIADEMPQSTALLQLLWADRLGYRLVLTTKNTPQFAGITFNDDLADESISVYDHPKASIFKNTGRFTPEQIIALVNTAPQIPSLPTLDQIKLRSAEETINEGAPSALNEPVSVILWIALLLLFTLLALPWVALALPRSRDLGLGVAPMLGLLAAGLSHALLVRAEILRGTSAAAWVVTATIFLLGVYGAQQFHGGLRTLIRKTTREAKPLSLLFFGVFTAFLAMRLISPAAFGGEKTMDLSFLRFFLRNESLPPQDPWAAGHTMTYYYLGTYLYSFVLKMLPIAPGIGYNLALCTVAATIATSTYSLMRIISRSTIVALAAPLFLLFTSNFEALNQRFIRLMQWNYDLFWATSRGLHSPAISEYTLWSLIFADLHAHVIALPLMIINFALAASFLRGINRPWDRSRSALTVLMMLCWGASLVMNSWDFITVSALMLTALLVGILSMLSHNNSTAYKLNFSIAALFQTALAGALGALLVAPLFFGGSTGPQPGYNWVRTEEFNTLSQILLWGGHWAVPLILGMVILLLRYRRDITRVAILAALLAAALPLLLGAWNALSATMQSGQFTLIRFNKELADLPWSVLTFCAAMMGCGIALATARRIPRGVRVAGMFAAFAASIIGAAELIFLMDRMNTIFKFYNPVWLLLACALAAITPHLLSKLRSGAFVRWSSYVVLTIALLPAVESGAAMIWIMCRYNPGDGPRFTLDSEAHLWHVSEEDARIVTWLNSRIVGNPVILEAQGDAYQRFTRIVKHTGLKTVLGWEHHVKQRGLSPLEVEQRKRDISTIYQTPDALEATRLLTRYNVQLIVVGPLERERYSQDALAKFEQHPENFPLLYRSGRDRIYGVSSFPIMLKKAFPS